MTAIEPVEVGALLRQRRRDGRITQADIMLTARISREQVRRIERGEFGRVYAAGFRRYVAALGGTLRIEMLVGEETVSFWGSGTA